MAFRGQSTKYKCLENFALYGISTNHFSHSLYNLIALRLHSFPCSVACMHRGGGEIYLQVLCIRAAARGCPPLTSIPNGFIFYGSDMTPNFNFGTTVTYSCNDGFILVGGGQSPICNGFEWSRVQPPSCNRKSYSSQNE